ncbi:hypothetical protein BBJ28_00012342 [Nothophytophthora sp. Chile5]|nr:hypothetical protein BBJ28_00012342 [Nothophytophthora sp. Chile5]
MALNQYEKDVTTPVLEEAQYRNDSTALRLDVSAPGAADSKKERSESVAPIGKDGRPLKKFLWWRMTKKQRIWLIVALSVLLVAVILIIIFFAIIPAVFQHYTNAVAMTINFLDVTAIPDATTLTIDLSLNVQHDVGISATTDATTASLLFGGSVFGTVALPALDIKKGAQNYNLTIAGPLTITDLDVFNSMAEGMVDSTEISLEADAKIKAHGLGLTYGGLSFERTLALTGFNQFSDPAPSIEYIDWFGCSNDVYQMDINVTLDNPSGMGLDGIGALNLSLYYGADYLGYAISQKPELGLPRGESDQVFRLTVPQDSSVLTSMVMGVVAGSAQYYIVGDNPYATEYTQFAEAIATVNMSVLYTDGLTKLNINSSCNILSLLS